MANLIVQNAQASSVLLPHLTLTLKTSMTATVKPLQTTKSDKYLKMMITMIPHPFH